MSSVLPTEWRLRRKRGRRKPIAELTCKCESYSFPHRFGGGACNGRSLADKWWADRACGDCRSIDRDAQTFAPYCRVVDGGEGMEDCEMFQEFMQRNGVRIKGIKWK